MNSYARQFCTQFPSTWDLVKESFADAQEDYCSLKSFRLAVLGNFAKFLDLSWIEIIQLFRFSTPIHADLKPKLASFAKNEESKLLLSQPFVSNVKLVRILKQQPDAISQELLAVDGLLGSDVLSHGPNFDAKNYLFRLTFGARSLSPSVFDTHPYFQRRHAQAVRQTYEILKCDPTLQSKRPAEVVYRILRRVVFDAAGVELPLSETLEEVPKELFETCVGFYKEEMGDVVHEWIRSLNLRGDKRKRSVEDGGGGGSAGGDNDRASDSPEAAEGSAEE